jgi:4-hydroxybenzoate polyprenyltransferase
MAQPIERPATLKHTARQSAQRARTLLGGERDGSLYHYIATARPDHWFKNVFALPGFVMAALFSARPILPYLGALLLGLAAMCLIASANYVVNGWVDRETDGHHPSKRSRPLVRGTLNGRLIAIEYLLLAGGGLALSWLVSLNFAIISLLFLTQGIVYNVRPIRTKDRPYLDVFSESINNPLRFAWGWFIVAQWPLPSLSLLFGYWLAGAFLMALKRYAEYRSIGDPTVAALYRRSFGYYTEERLLILALFCSLFSSFLLGVFMAQYRIELVLSFPIFSMIFAEYFRLSMLPESAVQAPEKLYRQKWLMVLMALAVIVVGLLLIVDIPWLEAALSRAFPSQALW